MPRIKCLNAFHTFMAAMEMFEHESREFRFFYFWKHSPMSPERVLILMNFGTEAGNARQ